MEVNASGEDVRTRKTLERELCSVGTTANRSHLWWHTTLFHRLQHDVDDMHVRINLLLHVIVLVVDSYVNSTLAVFLVHLLCYGSDEALAVFEYLTVVVTDDI